MDIDNLFAAVLCTDFLIHRRECTMIIVLRSSIVTTAYHTVNFMYLKNLCIANLILNYQWRT